MAGSKDSALAIGTFIGRG